MLKLSRSLEDYLESIYILQQKNGEVRMTDIACMLEISKPSVNRAVRSLKNFGLVHHEKYGTLTLTNEGQKIAKDVYFRHRVITEFLIEKLKIEPKIAEEEACKIEHAISSETLRKIVKYSKNDIEN